MSGTFDMGRIEMLLNPQTSSQSRTLGDLRALAAAAHVAPEALEELITAGLLEPAHRLPTGALYDLHPNRLQRIREEHAKPKNKP
jgi:hypothetical protein